MLFRWPGLSAALALAASSSAFLVPIDTSKSNDINFDDDVAAELAALPPQMNGLPTGRAVALDCPGCGEGQLNMMLHFTTESDALLMNGAQMYPLTAIVTKPTVHVVDPSNSPEDIDPSSVPEDIDLSSVPEDIEKQKHEDTSVRAVSKSSIMIGESQPDEQGNSLVTLRLGIQALEGKPLAVDDIIVKLVKLPSSDVLIHSVETTSPALPPTAPTPEDEKECANLPPLLCKWRAIISGKLHGLKGGCKKGKFAHGLPTHNRPHLGPDGKLKFEHGHGHHRHHKLHRFHRVMRIIVRSIINVLVPIMIGIAAGMTASLVGMVVGQLIAFLWIKYRRGGQRGNAGYIVVAEHDMDDDDGSSIGDEETLPAYVEKAELSDEGVTTSESMENPPKYEESQEQKAPAEMP